MSATITSPTPPVAGTSGTAAARRAVVRWAWRLFRREWRQQLLVLGLVVVAVAATVIGASVSINTPTPTAATFGTAQDLAILSSTGPRLRAEIASLRSSFAKIDVIEDETVRLPGSVQTFELRAQDPHGPFGRPMLSLLAGQNSALNPETISLAGLTLGMLLIALVSVGGFTILAHRRLRALGMLAAQGATEDHVALVVRANGLVVGAAGAFAGVALAVAGWIAYRPRLQASTGHAIGVWALPWLVVGVAVALAVVATYLAAARPARAVSRIPVVAALSGRPVPPRPLRRSAIPGIAFLAAAFLLLGYSGSQTRGGSGSGMAVLVLGLVALVPAIILLSPFCLSLLGRFGRRAPVAARLALRDLDRHRARSGSPLAAISLGVMIAVIVAIVAAARYANVLDYVGPNLASNQLVIYTPNGPYGRAAAPGAPGTSITGSTLASMVRAAHGIASGLGAQEVIELETTNASLRHAAAGRNWNGPIYVATPSLLSAYGIASSQIEPRADILTHRPGISGLSRMQLVYGAPTKALVAPGAPAARGTQTPGGPGQSDFPCLPGQCLANPVVQEVGALPAGTSAPNTVITENAVAQLGLAVQTSGWLLQAPKALSASQIDGARRAAAAAGMAIETKNDEPSGEEVINVATVAGVALALAILAMSIGLIRSDAAADLRTLTAAGAGTGTRRKLSAATAGALGLLGAILGTVTGYVGVIGYLRSNSLNGGVAALGNVPVANLLIVVVGMPVAAAAVGWLLAGREPPAIAHQPIE